MPSLLLRGAIAIVLLTLAPAPAMAFCGFYVAGADAKLFNNATVVVLMREGTTTVLSMQNNYDGPPESFALVVPVPVVLAEENVKTLSNELFDRIDALAAPRLVEYWETDPCDPGSAYGGLGLMGTGRGGGGTGSGYGRGSGFGVTVEAEFVVGEYEIVILSAKDSSGLDAFLRTEGYAIPEGAEPLLRPYVEGGSKFFVAKVDVSKVKIEEGRTMLSPLRFHYESEEFSLPVRLGLINSAGTQDLIVHILSRSSRYEVANYDNVTIPTNLPVGEETRGSFGAFYGSLFDATVAKHPGAVVTEYAWDSSSCDPCPVPALTPNELWTVGADVLPPGTDSIIGLGGTGTIGLGPGPGWRGRGAGAPGPGGVGIGTLGRPPGATPGSSHAGTVRAGATTVSGSLDKEIIRRIMRRHLSELRFCYDKELRKNPKLVGRVALELTIEADGKTGDAKALSDDTGSKTLAACLIDKAGTWVYPRPPGRDTVTVRVPYVMTTTAVGPPPRSAPRFVGSFVLTRLHVRYGRDALGEDLVFREAKPIAGGREHLADGTLERGSVASSMNNFQARYAIRHPWTGPIECDSPTRGRWGGPPAGTERETGVEAAKDIGFAPRGGGITLASFVREDVPEIGFVLGAAGTGAGGGGTGVGSAEPVKAPSTGSMAPSGSAPPVPSADAACTACAVGRPHRSDGQLFGPMVLALVALGGGLGARRRRRRQD